MLSNFIFGYILLSFFFVFIMLFSMSFLTLWERKLLGGIQSRHGPIYTGIFGILQPFADGLKLIFKTFNFPTGGYFHVFLGASIFSLTLSLLPWAMLPFNELFVFADVNCGLLLILLISSLNKYTILFSGWSSNSKYGVLGSMSSGAQMASYEMPLLMSLLPMILLSSNLNLTNIVCFQNNFFWFMLMAPNAFIFFVCLLAETNRAPFDLPEAESELVAGYNMEYSSISFAVFFLAEYNHVMTASFLFSLLFLGGWNFFFITESSQFYQTLFLVIKTILVVNLMMYVRGVLPRYKFTDLITMCWQMFVPVTTLIFLLIWFLSMTNMFIANLIINTNIIFMYHFYLFLELTFFLEKIHIFSFFNSSKFELGDPSLEFMNEDDYLLGEENRLFQTFIEDDYDNKDENDVLKDKLNSEADVVIAHSIKEFKKFCDKIMMGIIKEIIKVTDNIKNEVMYGYKSEVREEEVSRLGRELDELKKELIKQVREDLVKELGVDITKEIEDEINNFEVRLKDPSTVLSENEIVIKVIEEIKKKIIKELEKKIIKDVASSFKYELEFKPIEYWINEDGVKVELITNEIESDIEYEIDKDKNKVEMDNEFESNIYSSYTFLYKNLLWYKKHEFSNFDNIKDEFSYWSLMIIVTALVFMSLLFL